MGNPALRGRREGRLSTPAPGVCAPPPRVRGAEPPEAHAHAPGLSPRRAPAPSRGRPPHPRAAGPRVRAARVKLDGNVLGRHSGGTLGARRGPAGPPGTPTDWPAVWPRGAGPGWGGRGRDSLRRRGQSGAGGVRTGPMAAREWALLGDRVMGWAARRSLTPAEGAPGGVTAGHRSAARPPQSYGPARVLHGSRSPRVERGTDTAWRGSNKGAPLGRGTRARTWPLAPTGAHTPRLKLQPCVSVHSPAHMVTELRKRPRLPDRNETDPRSRGQLRVQEGRPPSLAAMPCRTQAPLRAPKQVLCEASGVPVGPQDGQCPASSPPPHCLEIKRCTPHCAPWQPLGFAFTSSGAVWSRTLARDAQGQHRTGLAR